MSRVAKIVKEVEKLGLEDFLVLRNALDRVEEKLWLRELGRAAAKRRRAKLIDANIDELVLKRRYRGATRGS